MSQYRSTNEVETQWAIAMEWLAKREGRTKGLPEMPDRQRQKKVGIKRNASPETLKMMRMIAERPYSTRELSKIIGITTDQVSWRLMSMVRNDFLSKGEMDRSGPPCATFMRGRRMDEWLAVYEGMR